MDLRTTYLGIRLPHPLIVGAGPLGDDLDRVQGARRRRGVDAGAAFAVRGGNHRRADGRIPQQRNSTASRSPRRGHLRPNRSSRSAPTNTSSICGRQVRRRHSRHGVAQRSHTGRLDFLRQAARTGGCGRPRAAHLSRRQRHDIERGRRGTAGDRHRARGEAQPSHSGRRQACAAPDGLRAFRQAARRRPAPTGSCSSRASTAWTSTSMSST